MLQERVQAPVPFFDPRPMHDGLKAAILADVADLIDSGSFANGPHVAAFEEEFARWCRTRCCVGVGSGLDALRLGLLAAGVEPGDEVVVPANTFVATVEAISQAGATPVLADASEFDYNLDPAAAAAAVTPRTRYLMPVHLYGQLADMAALERIGLPMVEDACQAHGATRDGRSAGASGVAAAFSFYPAKNLGAMGDAGALVTNCDDVAQRVRVLREHGQTRKYRHEVSGWTARLDTIQALVLLHKLPLLDKWNAQRRALAARYSDRLAGVGDLRLPLVPRGSEPVWHLYVVRSSVREGLMSFLSARGIGCGLHYPEPVHLTGAYAHLGHRRGEFPVSETLADEIISLPIFPGMTTDQQDVVVEAVVEYFGG
jgi:dTDP-4-amino-4,6-dideoxygalactose transaminase